MSLADQDGHEERPSWTETTGKRLTIFSRSSPRWKRIRRSATRHRRPSSASGSRVSRARHTIWRRPSSCRTRRWLPRRRASPSLKGGTAPESGGRDLCPRSAAARPRSHEQAHGAVHRPNAINRRRRVPRRSGADGARRGRWLPARQRDRRDVRRRQRSAGGRDECRRSRTASSRRAADRKRRI